MTPIKPCRFRSLETIGQNSDRYQCYCPKVIAPHGVDFTICNTCPFREEIGLTEKDGPSFFDQIKTFVKATANYVAKGCQNVTEEQYQERMNICQSCEHFKDNRCMKCGCKVGGDIVAKARWSSEDCPIGKWPKIPLL